MDMQPVGETIADLFERLAKDARARCREAEAERMKGLGATREEEEGTPRPASGRRSRKKPQSKVRNEPAMEMDCLAVRFTPTNQPIFMLKGGKY